MNGLWAGYKDFLQLALLVDVLDKVDGARTHKLILTEQAYLADIW